VLRIIAIWNKNRIVVAISFFVWATNVAFLIQGESERLSPPPFCRPRISFKHIRSQVLPGSALHGRLSNIVACYTIPRATNPTSSPPSSPTSYYCTSCSSDCSAYAVMEAALLAWEGYCGNRVSSGSSLPRSPRLHQLCLFRWT